MRLRLSAIAIVLLPSSWALALTTTTATFQKGDANGYSSMTELRISMTPGSDGTNGASVTNFGVDGYVADDPATPANEFSPDQPSLTKFDNIFGAGQGQIPAGATILSATLTMKTTNGGSADTNGPWSIASLNQPFDLATTRYMSFPSADPLGFRGPWWQDGSPTPYSQRPQGGFGRLTFNQIGVANIQPLVQQWSSNPASNNGFVIQSGFVGTSNAWNYYTSGTQVIPDRPKLTVTYTTSPIVTNTFQHGVNGYTGDTSAFVKSGLIQTASATNPDPSVDDVSYDGLTGNPTVSPTSTINPPPAPITDGNAFLDGPAFGVDPGVLTSTDDSGLFKFGNVFGAAVGQAPADKGVAKAWLVLTTGIASGNARSPDTWEARAMSRDWDGTSLYSSSFGAIPGFQSDDGDMAATPLDTKYGMTTGSQIWFDVTSYLEGVRTGAADHGLIVLHGQDTADGWQIQLANGPDETLRPKLVVVSDLTPIVPPGVAGDYNGNGVVDAADYVLWRKGGTLQNEVATVGSVTPEDYTEWRARFGNTSGSGSSLGGAAVPEPASVALGLIASCGVCLCLSRKR